MKPIAKFGEMPFNVGGIKVFAAVDKDAQAITDELYIISERSTRVFDLINSSTDTIYTFMSMVSHDKNFKNLDLTATASEIQAILAKNQFVVKVYDDQNTVLGYAYKFFPNKIVLSNGVEVQVTDYSAQTSERHIAVQSVTVAPTTISGHVGDVKTITETVLPANASDKSVTWSSDDALTASVDQSGSVNLLKIGNTTIKATSNDDGTKVASCTVTITAP